MQVGAGIPSGLPNEHAHGQTYRQAEVFDAASILELASKSHWTAQHSRRGTAEIRQDVVPCDGRVFAGVAGALRPGQAQRD